MICGCKKNSNTVSACNRHLRHTPLNMSWKRCWIFTFVFFCSINIISASHELNFRYYAEQLTVPLVDSIKHGGEDMMRERLPLSHSTHLLHVCIDRSGCPGRNLPVRALSWKYFLYRWLQLSAAVRREPCCSYNCVGFRDLKYGGQLLDFEASLLEQIMGSFVSTTKALFLQWFWIRYNLYQKSRSEEQCSLELWSWLSERYLTGWKGWPAMHVLFP